jgi:hypothetical protein
MLISILRGLGRILKFAAALVVTLLPTYVAVAAALSTGAIVGTVAAPPVAILAALIIGFWTMSVLSVAWFLKTLAFVGRLLVFRVEESSNWLLGVGPYVWKGGQTAAITTGTVLAIVAGSGSWKGAEAGPIFALIGVSIVVGAWLGLVIGAMATKRKQNIAATILAFDKLPAFRLLIAHRAKAMRSLNDDLLAMPSEFQTTIMDKMRFYGDLSPEDKAKVLTLALIIDDLPAEIRDILA